MSLKILIGYRFVFEKCDFFIVHICTEILFFSLEFAEFAKD